MAIGRREVTVTTGRAGRVSAPQEVEERGIFVRDPAAAEAAAIRERVAAFKGAGQVVPEYLQSMLDHVTVPESASTIKVIDPATGEPLDVEVVHVDKPGWEGKEPVESPLPDAVSGPSGGDLPAEVVRPMPESVLPEGAAALPVQEQPVLDEGAQARVDEHAAAAEAAEKAAIKAEKAHERAEARAEARAEKKAEAEAEAEAEDDAPAEKKAASQAPRRSAQRGR